MNLGLGMDPTLRVAVPHDDGHMISERTSRIIELIREYDDHLDVMWIPPEKRGINEPAFVVVERLADGSTHSVFYVQDEDAFDGSVLERIYNTDVLKQGGNPSAFLNNLDARNRAVKAIAEKVRQEALEEYIEEAYAVLKSPLHRYKGSNGKVYE